MSCCLRQSQDSNQTIFRWYCTVLQPVQVRRLLLRALTSGKSSFPATMPPETATCPGCDHTFSLRGYQSHLALTRDPLCRAVFDKLKIANDAYEFVMSAERNSGAGSDTEAVAVPFKGDMFGTAQDYASDTFGQFMDEDDNPDPPPLMEVSDDEDDDEDDDEEDLGIANMVAELEKSWEPPREGAPRRVDDEQLNPGDFQPQDEENDDDDPEDEPEEHTQRNVDRFIIGDGYGVKPTIRIRYNDKHPSACAGQPLTREESRDYTYGAALGGGDNPWAPFNSRKDWEIARWAKLRGVGSTAFSELLAIDGVRFN
jgi:hypothetical protein